MRDWHTPEGRAELAISNWRFPIDNPNGDVPFESATLDAALIKAVRDHGIPLALACDGADWFDECRASALGG